MIRPRTWNIERIFSCGSNEQVTSDFDFLRPFLAGLHLADLQIFQLVERYAAIASL